MSVAERFLRAIAARDFEAVAGRGPRRIRWHTRGRDPDWGWQENDHTGYAEIADDRIKAPTVSCAGFRPVPDPADRG